MTGLNIQNGKNASTLYLCTRQMSGLLHRHFASTVSVPQLIRALHVIFQCFHSEHGLNQTRESDIELDWRTSIYKRSIWGSSPVAESWKHGARRSCSGPAARDSRVTEDGEWWT